MRWRLEPRDNPACPSRRAVIGLGALILTRPALAGPSTLDFSDIYEASGVLGLAFTAKVLALKGQIVAMQGYMAPPLRAESEFFVLTRDPVSLCPFCSSDADWPTDIVVIYLRKAAAPTRYSDPIAVVGRLDIGSWTDPDNGFVSQLRLMDAAFRIV